MSGVGERPMGLGEQQINFVSGSNPRQESHDFDIQPSVMIFHFNEKKG
jgi:hypothetical protein